MTEMTLVLQSLVKLLGIPSSDLGEQVQEDDGEDKDDGKDEDNHWITVGSARS